MAQSFPYPIKTQAYKDVTGGINISDSIVNLKPNESPYMLNYLWTQAQGLTSRGGMALLSAVPGSGAIQFHDVYKPQIATLGKVMLAVRSGTLYSVNLSNGATTSLLGGLSSTLMFDGVNFNNECYLCNTTDGVIRVYYNGSTLTAVLQAGAPLIAAICDNGYGRLCGIGALANPNYLYYCAYLNGTDWTTTGDAGFAQVPVSDVMNSINTSGTSVYVGGKKSLVSADTRNPLNMSFNLIPSEAGTINQASSVTMDSFLRFLTPNKGLWGYQYFFPQPFGDKMYPTFVGYPTPTAGIIPNIQLNLGALSKAAAVQDGYFYRISLPKLGSSVNNCQIIIDTRNNSCGYFEGQNIGYWSQDNDTNTLYGSDSSNGNIYIMNTGLTDNGNPILLDYISSCLDLGMPESQKIGSFAKIQTQNSGTDQVYFSYLFDLGNSGVSKQLTVGNSINLWGTSTAVPVLQYGTDPNNAQDLWSSAKIIESKINMLGQGAYINVRISSTTGVTSQINVLSYEIGVVQLLPN